MKNLLRYLTPNFRFNHPLNQLFLALVFFGSFSFASIAQAFEDDGTWLENHYVWIRDYNGYGMGPTATLACQRFGDLSGQSVKWGQFSNGTGCGSADGSGLAYYTGFQRRQCNGDGSDPGYSGCGQLPDPVEPQNCTDLADQNPDGVVIATQGYSLEACSNGCKVYLGGGSSSPAGDDTWTSTGYYSSEECNGGFDLAKGTQPLQDTYQHDDQLQNCYDATGRLLGQIGVNQTCPEVSVCYDASTGQAIGTTSSSTACESGVKYNELSKDIAQVDPANTSTTVTVNADGTSTEVKETVIETTGLDGTTEVIKETTVTDKDSQGTVVGSTTTQEKTTRKSTVSCSDRPDLPECQKKDDAKATAKLSDNCVTPPVCTGDPVGCAQVELQWRQYCVTQAITETEFEDWRTQQSTIEKYGVETDENGMLASLNKGEINVQETLGLNQLGDKGAAGSCPTPHSMGLLGTVIEFRYDSICAFADSVRPLIILSSIFLCMLMVSRSLVGA